MRSITTHITCWMMALALIPLLIACGGGGGTATNSQSGEPWSNGPWWMARVNHFTTVGNLMEHGNVKELFQKASQYGITLNLREGQLSPPLMKACYGWNSGTILIDEHYSVVGSIPLGHKLEFAKQKGNEIDVDMDTKTRDAKKTKAWIHGSFNDFTVVAVHETLQDRGPGLLPHILTWVTIIQGKQDTSDGSSKGNLSPLYVAQTLLGRHDYNGVPVFVTGDIRQDLSGQAHLTSTTGNEKTGQGGSP